jgi:hypothetical protein
MIDPAAEDQCQDEVAEAEQERLPNPHLLAFAVENTEIQHEQHKNEEVKADPHPEGVHENISNPKLLFSGRRLIPF